MTFGPNWAVTKDEGWWWLQDRVCFYIRPERIEIDAREVEDSLVHALMLEAPMVMAMIFRAQFCLPAAAVTVQDKAILFCGAAGSGRSTAAVRQALTGELVIADSVARIELNEHEAMVIPQGSGSLLWPESLEKLGIAHKLTTAVRGDSLIRRIKLDSCLTPRIIDQIFWRNPYSGEDPPYIETKRQNALNERQRFRRLALATAGRLWIDPAHRTAEHFRWCLSIARHCPLSTAPQRFFEW